jgi:hypothetical protein
MIPLTLWLALLTTNGASQNAGSQAGTETEQWHAAAVLRLNGETLLALEVVLQKRQRDEALRPSERDARNFLITVLRKDPLLRRDEEGKAILIGFSPRYAPGEPEKLHGATDLGRPIFYVVSLDHLSILRTGDPRHPPPTP